MLKTVVRTMINRLGYDVVRLSPSSASKISIAQAPYVERPEHGAGNLKTKLENMRHGLPFEFPDMLFSILSS